MHGFGQLRDDFEKLTFRRSVKSWFDAIDPQFEWLPLAQRRLIVRTHRLEEASSRRDVRRSAAQAAILVPTVGEERPCLTNLFAN